jgi:hypothetical protein
MLKYLLLVLPVFFFTSVQAQVLTDSPLYQQLKASGQLGTVNTEANTSIQLPVAPVKPASYNKANACDCYIEPDSTCHRLPFCWQCNCSAILGRRRHPQRQWSGSV